MDEKRQLLISVFGSLALLFFLITRFFMPIAKDNAERLSTYKKLKLELKAVKAASKGELDSFERRADAAISDLEKKFLTSGKAEFIKQLTRVPGDSNIIFTNIAHREPYVSDRFRAYSVDITMRAPFYDLIKYLAKLEEGPSMIVVDSLNLTKVDAQAQSLDIKVTFLAFQLTYAVPPIEEYAREEYKILNKFALEKLLEPVNLPDSKGAVLRLKGYNPFVLGSSEGVLAKKTIPSDGERTEVSNLSLEGIVRIGDEKAAMINGSAVKKGEHISDMEVIDIEQDRVVLRRLDREYILKMGVDDGILQK
jgi:hypothetical protein